jgi:hypothetical protein
MRRVAEEMYAEPRYRSAMLESIEIFGVDWIHRISGHDQGPAQDPTAATICHWPGVSEKIEEGF